MLKAVFLVAMAAVGAAGAPPTDAVDPDLPRYRPAPTMKGEVSIASGVLMAAWAREFMLRQPGVEVRLGKPTESSTQALQSLLDGGVQLASFGAEIQPFQREMALKAVGYAPFVVAVASGGAGGHLRAPAYTGEPPGLAIYVNAGNPLSRATLTQLDAVFSKTRRRGYPVGITTWGQLGLTGEWADKPIRRYGMALNNQHGYPHGWVYFLMQRMMDDGEFKPDIVQVPDTAYGPGQNYAFAEVVDHIVKDRYGIAHAPFSFRVPGVKTLALAENASSPFYAGTREEIAHRYYPLTMTKCLSALRKPGTPLDPVVRELVRYVLSREGQEVVAATPGDSLPLTAVFAAEQRAKLDGSADAMDPHD